MGTFINLKGLRFGKLKVIERVENDKNGKVQWRCVCDCGRNINVRTNSLIQRGQSFCGKCTNDLTGLRFGRLLVLKEDARFVSKSKSAYSKKQYLCKCDCGKEVSVLEALLLNGHTTSCGCFHKEKLSQRMKSHGESGTRLYSIWSGIKDRCFNKNDDSFFRYGGRGITLCEDWLIFENFSKWAKNNGYSDKLTIERKDVNSGYCPQNCCWIPIEEQAKNRRNTCRIQIGNEFDSLSSWCKRLKIPYSWKKRKFAGTVLEKPYKNWLKGDTRNEV